MPMSPTLLGTLVMYINGAANLYFNNGAEYIGAAQKYQTVAQPARIAVASAPRLLPEAVKTTATDFIYLISKNGIYKKDLRLANLPNESKEMQSFFYLYQQVMGALRNAQVKDRSNAGK